MKSGNIALSILVLLLLTSMVWVNTQLKEVYHEIDFTDKLRSYLTIETDQYSILKVSGSNGYPIDIKQSENPSISVLRSRASQLEHRIEGDTLIIRFSGARVSPASLAATTTPAGLIISSSKLSGVILTDTHNRVTGFSQPSFTLDLRGESYTEITDNQASTLRVKASQRSSFEFYNKNTADTAYITLKDNSVGFLDGLSYHRLQPAMEDSSLMVLSKSALQALIKK